MKNMNVKINQLERALNDLNTKVNVIDPSVGQSKNETEEED